MKPTAELLEISIDEQRLRVISGGCVVAEMPVSSSSRGIGSRENSYRTPTGEFGICEMIGGGEDINAIFKGREVVGKWDGEEVHGGELILSRILRLEGFDEDNRNSKERFIYIHGTNDEAALGRPGSHGCIRLSRRDAASLFDMVDLATRVRIIPPVLAGPKLVFMDCDSTLSRIEGIDELARARGPEIFRQVVDLTNAAMDGKADLSDVFRRRLEVIRPDLRACDEVKARYIAEMVPGAAEVVRNLKQQGWRPVILSGGFECLIRPLAEVLGIDDIEAVPLHLDADGQYAGYDAEFPTTRNQGKCEVIREWKAALRPSASVMVGDGISDAETRHDVDCFVGFGGVVARDKVRELADVWLENVDDLKQLLPVLRSLSDRNPMP